MRNDKPETEDSRDQVVLRQPDDHPQATPTEALRRVVARQPTGAEARYRMALEAIQRMAKHGAYQSLIEVVAATALEVSIEK